MKDNDQINYLRESAFKLLKSSEFKGVAVILLAITLEKQVKNVVIYNYRKSGLSAAFIRARLLKKMGYSELLHELEWAASFPENKKIKQIWKEARTGINDVFGIMEIRNRLVHSNRHVSFSKIESNVNDLLCVLEKFTEIFYSNFGYNGLEALPKTIKSNEINASVKIFNRSIIKKVNKEK